MPLPSDNDLTFRTTDAAKWGAGKGSPLTKEEADNNFWALLLLIADLAENPAQPLEIADITVEAGQMTITLSDGETTFGPFDLPEQAFNWTDAYQGGHDYERFDVFTANEGAYLVLQNHTSATEFDPDANNMSGPLYALMFPYQNIYDIGFFYPGLVGANMDAGDAMFAYRFARQAFLPADLFGSVAGFVTDPVDAVWEVEIYKNDELIGSYSFDPFASSGGGSGEFLFPDDVQFEINDVLRVNRPASNSGESLDSVARGFTMTLAARKGTPT